MPTKKLEELNRDELWEDLCVQNQSLSGSKAKLSQRLTDNLEKEGIDPVIYTLEDSEDHSTIYPPAQILEKLSAADQHFAYLTAMSTQTNQQQEHPAVISAKVDQQQKHLQGDQKVLPTKILKFY